MITYRDKEGRPIEMLEWAKLFETPKYRVVEQTTTPSGIYWVSTVWLGMSASGHIFESMVSRRDEADSGHWVEQTRYHTLAEAQAGHAALVAKWNDVITDAVSRLGGDEV